LEVRVKLNKGFVWFLRASATGELISLATRG